MTRDLVCGAIGVQANQREAIDLAHRHGFTSVEARAAELAEMGEAGVAAVVDELRAKGLVWGAAGLPVDFRNDEARFREDLQALPRLARALAHAGVTRVGTWLMPSHAALTYRRNFQQHVTRLQPVADVLGDHGLRLGLEYVGTRTLLNRQPYPFLHTMAETLELLDAIGRDNMGLVMDSWHWYTAGEDADAIRALRPEQVVAADLNDAPAGVPVADQLDGNRELPLATGVIDTGDFLGALHAIGYDGPVRCEPFNATLNGMDNETAAAAASDALRRAFALIET